MKKNKGKIVLTVILVCVVVLAGYEYNRFSYAKQASYFEVKAKADAGLTIGLIGDSWVAGQKFDSTIHYSLLAAGINNMVVSSGEPGAKTKLIYQNIFKEKGDSNSSRFVIESRPDYGVVVAGVNDAVGQLGKDFYAHHMEMIIRTMLHYNIKPIVVELPEFAIERATAEMNFVQRNMNKAYAGFTNGGQINDIQAYRSYFKNELKAGHLDDSITYIPFNNICTDYKQCTELYANAAHLSKAGNIKLGKLIAAEIAGKYKK